MRDVEASPEPLEPAAGELVLPGDPRGAAASVRRYLEAAKAANTRTAYAADADHFAGWCADRGTVALPASPELVAAYLSSLADRGAKSSTVTRRASGIAHAHRQAGQPSPTAHPGVREVLQGIRRDAATRGQRPKKARGLTLDQLRALVEDLDDTLAGRRDRALILTGYALGLRASDLVGLRVEDLTPAGDGLDVMLRRSKTDQTGAGETLALAPGAREATCPVTALTRWLEVTGLLEGPLFRSVAKSGTKLGTAAMAPSSVRRILLRAANRGGVSVDRLSPHSLRRGFATTAYAAGVPEAEIARTGRWRSLTVMRAYNDADRWANPASGRIGL